MKKKKPNTLVIWGDDIGWYNVSAYNLGLMGYKTPNIDRIAKEGALFTDWYGLFALVPAGALVGQWMQTLVEFPPRQSPESWSPGDLMEKLKRDKEALDAGK